MDQFTLLLMELCDVDLFQVIHAQGAQTEAGMCHVFRQIIDCLCDCHALGIAHLDIKPENILLIASGDYHGRGVAGGSGDRDGSASGSTPGSAARSASHLTPVAMGLGESPIVERESIPRANRNHREDSDQMDGEGDDDETVDRSELNESSGSQVDTLRARAKLADFGSCALVNKGSVKATTTYTGGTPPYSAPEVCKAEHRPSLEFDGFRADAWSCGVLLYVVASNCVPWDTAEMTDPKYAAFIQTYYPEWLDPQSRQPRARASSRDAETDALQRGYDMAQFDDDGGGETPMLTHAKPGILAEQ